MLEAFLDLVFPQRCAGCGRPGHRWCQSCDSQLQRLPPSRGICHRCGAPTTASTLCAECRTHALPLTVRSFARYRGPLRRAIVRLKYRPDRALGKLMGSWLAGLYRSTGWTVALIVPVPLADGRLKARGYNQVNLITNALGNALRIAQSDSALTRVRETPSQVGLEPIERRRNVMGAFCASSEHLRDKNVLVVDDLFTTGATLAACAAALNEAGAAKVFGLTVGRTWSG